MLQEFPAAADSAVQEKQAQLARGAAALREQQERKQQRMVMLIRAGVLVVVGVVIALTATMHENLDANRWLFGIAFILIGVAAFIRVPSPSGANGLCPIRPLP